MIVVLAGNYREFLVWCREQRRSPRDRYVIYAADENCLHGLRGVGYVVFGTFWDRSDSRLVFQAAEFAELR